MAHTRPSSSRSTGWKRKIVACLAVAENAEEAETEAKQLPVPPRDFVKVVRDGLVEFKIGLSL